MVRMNRRGQFFTTIASVKMMLYVVYITLVSVVMVIGLNVYLNRGVEVEDLEFFLVKKQIERDVLGDGEVSVGNLDSIKERFLDGKFLMQDYGAVVEVDGSKDFWNKDLYMSGGQLCKFDKYSCKDYYSWYLVDGNINEVKVGVVRQYG